MISEIIATAGEKMAKAVESAKEDFSGVRTGRANPQLFQKVMVDYYGTPTPLGQLGQLASITRVDWPRAEINLFLCKKRHLLGIVPGGTSLITAPVWLTRLSRSEFPDG